MFSHNLPHDFQSPDVLLQEIWREQREQKIARELQEEEALAKQDALTLYGLFGDSLKGKAERDCTGALRPVLDLPKGVKSNADPFLLCQRYHELRHAEKVREGAAKRLRERERDREALQAPAHAERTPSRTPAAPAESTRDKDAAARRHQVKSVIEALRAGNVDWVTGEHASALAQWLILRWVNLGFTTRKPPSVTTLVKDLRGLLKQGELPPMESPGRRGGKKGKLGEGCAAFVEYDRAHAAGVGIAGPVNAEH